MTDDVRDAHLSVGDEVDSLSHLLVGEVDSASPDYVRDTHLLVGGEVDTVSQIM